MLYQNYYYKHFLKGFTMFQCWEKSQGISELKWFMMFIIIIYIFFAKNPEQIAQENSILCIAQTKNFKNIWQNQT